MLKKKVVHLINIKLFIILPSNSLIACHMLSNSEYCMLNSKNMTFENDTIAIIKMIIKDKRSVQQRNFWGKVKNKNKTIYHQCNNLY